MFASLNARAVGLDLTAGETLALAHAAGFGRVDLMVRDLDAAGVDPADLRARMDGLGLRGGAFPLPVHWRGGPEEFARDLARLPGLARLASALGLTRTGTWVLPETPVGPGGPVSSEATRELHRDRLGRVARVLDDHGIRLGLEVIGVDSSRPGLGEPFVHRLADLGPLLDGLDGEAPNFGILVDAFHLYAAGEDVGAALAWGAGRVVWVHVADLPAASPGDRDLIRDHDRGLPGEHGAVESRRLLDALQRDGYDGPVTAEPMAGCRSLAGLTAEQVVRRVAVSLRSVWPGAGAGPPRRGLSG